MTKDQLRQVIRMAAIELDEASDRGGENFRVEQESFLAVKKFCRDWDNNGDIVNDLHWPKWGTPVAGADEEESE